MLGPPCGESAAEVGAEGRWGGVLQLWREFQALLKWCAGCGVGLNEAAYPGGDRWKPFSAVDCA